MITTTLDRLRGLRLGALADAYLAQQHDPAVSGLSFDERLASTTGFAIISQSMNMGR